jgi:hypothetical protein
LLIGENVLNCFCLQAKMFDNTLQV